jgi:hypothetical protein
MNSIFSPIRLTILMAVAVSPLAASAAPDVRITEDRRPEKVRRLISGSCDHHNYEVAVSIGRLPITASVLDARVDHRSLTLQLRDALAVLPTSARGISDVFFDRCDAKRARLQVDVLQTGLPPNVHHYYLWIGQDGSVELIGER